MSDSMPTDIAVTLIVCLPIAGSRYDAIRSDPIGSAIWSPALDARWVKRPAPAGGSSQSAPGLALCRDAFSRAFHSREQVQVVTPRCHRDVHR